MIKGLKELGMSVENFVSCLHFTDPFKDYPNVINRIKSEVGTN